MTGMTPERLDAIRANLPTPDADLSRRERDAHDLLAEVERLRAIEAGVKALLEDTSQHFYPTLTVSVEFVTQYNDPLVRTSKLRALLNPTEGETDGPA